MIWELGGVGGVITVLLLVFGFFALPILSE